MNKFYEHFKTITYHKYLVMKYCFRMGLFKQGITHDLSKYSPTEFLVGVKYFQGHRSPNNAEREDKGYSSSWLHHKGRNKHHYEYWLDYGGNKEQPFIGMRIPENYIVEMLADRIAACKVYQKDKYTNESPLKYYIQGRDFVVMHEESKELLEKLLYMLAKKGERYTFKYARKIVRDLKRGKNVI
ncbi:MAG: catalase [Tyzzerella sp.]|uniref:Catalase n=1 Tax=Candidatus Fimicola merdigallinarum TaxID=2840819 RepID=A0A9D9H294_9FIRM|nr:catalase [Candidatus Fimicola merdigallinarum]